MRVLAVDTATPRVGADYLDTESGLAVERSELDPRRHAELLTPLITQVLSEAGRSVADLDLIVTGVGPGPYTGLRVSVVTATTLGMALGVPVVGVCTLDGFAYDAVRTDARAVVVASDARRREVYWAAYDDTGRRIDGPMVHKPDVVAARAQLLREVGANRRLTQTYAGVRSRMLPLLHWRRVPRFRRHLRTCSGVSKAAMVLAASR